MLALWSLKLDESISAKSGQSMCGVERPNSHRIQTLGESWEWGRERRAYLLDFCRVNPMIETSEVEIESHQDPSCASCFSFRHTQQTALPKEYGKHKRAYWNSHGHEFLGKAADQGSAAASRGGQALSFPRCWAVFKIDASGSASLGKGCATMRSAPFSFTPNPCSIAFTIASE